MSEIENLCDIIIFGGHGDLSFRKLVPALYHLTSDGYLDSQTRIILTSRVDIKESDHIKLVRSKLKEFLKDGEFEESKFDKFKKQLYVVKIDLTQIDSYRELKKLLQEHPKRDRVNYLSTSPSFFGMICESLNKIGVITNSSRVVLEKPLGRDLKSSKEINSKVLKYFKESQVYRIDHYLGKETVQNILALRFSNRIFMPLWDANNIDHVQITVSESVGVEGRGGYYDDYGALRDMVQNHLLQLVCLIAMEPPCSLDADSIRDEKVKVLRSLRALTPQEISQKTVRGQYGSGTIDGKSVIGYKDEDGLSSSTTETFVAICANIDNWRWNTVPFYIRSGKRMSKKNSEIVIRFKPIPYSIFANNGHCITKNSLVISLQPDESIGLKLMNKIPGLTENMRLQEVELELNAPIDAPRKPLAYERLLLDVIRDNPTLFMRLDEVEAAWRWVDVILKGWEDNLSPMKSYSAGSDGPSAAIALIERDGRSWHE